jgi:multicomponent K+:H+ antiporter subunit D
VIVEHLAVWPILLPLLIGAALVTLSRRAQGLSRALNIGGCALLLGVSVLALREADDGGIRVYLLGNWPAHLGITLVLDRLSALMLCLSALLGLIGAIHAAFGSDRKAPYFHALWQFQLMGLNGAFLTADLFNLFVFFEVLLIASYGLLLHGAGRTQLKRGFHYVTFNLLGSALFLIAVATLYGFVGTLNMADLAFKIAGTTVEDAPFVRAAALLLLIVFALKAALLPLNFWLPRTYAAAPAAVAILFALMTKVGVYAILRVYPLLFGDSAGLLKDLAPPVLLPIGLLTLAIGALGALAARRLRTLIGYLVIVSAGTLLTAVGFDSAAAIGAALYYLVHSTLAAALMFALADAIARRRGTSGDSLIKRAPLVDPGWLGAGFFFAAMALAALPPLSGFLAKAQILQAIAPRDAGLWAWSILLTAGLLTIVALARAGIHLFWRALPADGAPALAPRLPLLLLVLALIGASVFAQRLVVYAQATALQVLAPDQMVLAVRSAQLAERGK